jgi:hypothetical protein
VFVVKNPFILNEKGGLVEKKLIFMEKKQIGRVAARENLFQNRLFPSRI